MEIAVVGVSQMAIVPSAEENPHGFHRRYGITKTNGEPVDDNAIYVVLRIDGGGRDRAHIAACRAATRAYCDFVESHGFHSLDQLAHDMRLTVDVLSVSQPVPCDVVKDAGE